MKSAAADKIPSHPTLLRRQLQARLKQLQARGPVLAASLVIIHRKCGREGCHCQKGAGHPAHYLTYKHEGKTHTVYVPKDLITEVKSWIKEHQRLRNLMREVSQRALVQVRTHVTHQRRKAGRS